MAVKASAQITLSYIVDVKATYVYYLLQSSTAATPSKPTVFPPTGSWDDTEPSYTEGSTKSLYFVYCTVFNDDKFVYSEVSRSSSYEASKLAYNKAHNAQQTANSANEKIDNLEIGGTNLIVQSTVTDGYRLNSSGEDYASTYSSVTGMFEIKAGEEVTFTVYGAHTDEGDTYFQLAFYTVVESDVENEEAITTFISRPIMYVATTTEERTSWTVTVPSTATHVKVAFPTSLIDRVKLEYGNRATDWSPSPEDVQGDIDDADEKAEDAQKRISVAEIDVDTINKVLSMLVVDEEGTTLLEQTSEGWSFNFADTLSQLSTANEEIKKQYETLGDIEEGKTVGGVLKELNDLTADLKARTAYIDMKEDKAGNPCLELGKRNDDSGFKVRITNSKIEFSLGSASPISLVNDDGVGYVQADKLIVDEELRHGGFAWQVRDNGNLGLIWKGVDE